MLQVRVVLVQNPASLTLFVSAVVMLEWGITSLAVGGLFLKQVSPEGK